VGVDSIAPGPRDHLVTRSREQQLEQLDPEVRLEGPLDPAEGHTGSPATRRGRSSANSPATQAVDFSSTNLRGGEGGIGTRAQFDTERKRSVPAPHQRWPVISQILVVVRIENEYDRWWAVIGRYCSNPSRRPRQALASR